MQQQTPGYTAVDLAAEIGGEVIDEALRSRAATLPQVWQVEFDGYEFHRDPVAFERDRRRRNELVLAGYVVLNFTWGQLQDRPDWVMSCIRRALAMR